MIFIYKIILFEHILISINCELYFFGSILGCKPHVSKWFHFLAIQALDRLIWSQRDWSDSLHLLDWFCIFVLRVPSLFVLYVELSLDHGQIVEMLLLPIFSCPSRFIFGNNKLLRFDLIFTGLIGLFTALWYLHWEWFTIFFLYLFKMHDTLLSLSLGLGLRTTWIWLATKFGDTHGRRLWLLQKLAQLPRITWNEWLW